MKFFASVQLTVALLGQLFLLILFATFSQVDIGIFEANKKYFTTWFVYLNSIPIFLGGYSIGLLLLINLIFSHVTNFKFRRSKVGIFFIHTGLILMIIGAALISFFAEEMQVAIQEGTDKNYVDYPRDFELVIIDQQPEHDVIYAIPIKDLSQKVDLHGILIEQNAYFPNAYLNQRGIPDFKYDQLGHDFKLISLPKTYKMSERNIPGLDISLQFEGVSYRFILWAGAALYQEISDRYLIKLRSKRQYLPFKIYLEDFTRETYTQSEKAKSFQSRVQIYSEQGKSTYDISMNEPLRYRGYTFFQSSFTDDEKSSVFQVVKNPSWLLPYISSIMITIGLFFQMLIRRPSEKN